MSLNRDRGKRTERECQTCKKIYEYRPGWSGRKFCSPECYYESKKAKTFICLVCGKEAVCRNGRKVCSPECAKVYYSKKITRSCLVCGKEFQTWPSVHKYCCSKECSVTNRKDFTEKAKNPNWRGGITPVVRKQRNSDEYKSWRNEVFKRDNFTCAMCHKVGWILHAHHIKPFSKYKQLRFDVKNGITLCEPCHKAVHRRETRWAQTLIECAARTQNGILLNVLG